MQKIILNILCFMLLTTAYGQSNINSGNEQRERIERLRNTQSVVEAMFVDFALKNNIPGIAYGIVADGRLIYSGCAGYTNVANKTQVKTQSVFRMASMSKSFTAMAIVKLRDEGKLNLDDPASKYIPQLRKTKYLTTDAAPITIRNLLTHAAGFPEDNPWGDRQLADTDQELLDIIEKGVSFSTVPGTSYEYSNLGFSLLGNIITKVSGKSYQQYITDNILKPLGMNNTYWEYTKVPAAKLAHGYRWINGDWREEELLHDGSYGAMGGLMSSVEDFAKYMLLHLDAWPPKNGKESTVLKRSSLREMHTAGVFSGFNAGFRYPNGGRVCPLSSQYGYGLGVTKDCEGNTWVGHSGGLPGFGSQWRIFTELGIGVVSFANRTYAGVGSINLAVLDTIKKLAQLKTRTLALSSILNQRKNELVKLLPDWKGAEKSGIFAENFFADYVIDSLKADARIIFTNAGRIVRVHDLIPENNLRGSFIMEGEKKNIEVFFTLTPENPALIQEYRIRETSKVKTIQ